MALPDSTKVFRETLVPPLLPNTFSEQEEQKFESIPTSELNVRRKLPMPIAETNVPPVHPFVLPSVALRSLAVKDEKRSCKAQNFVERKPISPLIEETPKAASHERRVVSEKSLQVCEMEARMAALENQVASLVDLVQRQQELLHPQQTTSPPQSNSPAQTNASIPPLESPCPYRGKVLASVFFSDPKGIVALNPSPTNSRKSLRRRRSSSLSIFEESKSHIENMNRDTFSLMTKDHSNWLDRVALPLNLNEDQHPKSPTPCDETDKQEEKKEHRDDDDGDRAKTSKPEKVDPSPAPSVKQRKNSDADNRWSSSNPSNSIATTPKQVIKTTFLEHLKRYNLDSSSLEHVHPNEDATADADMERFVMVPSRVEKLLLFGLGICVDCFLYILTILPIRFAWSIIALFCSALLNVRNNKNWRMFRFSRQHLYQLVQGFIIYAVYRIALIPLSIGTIYHWIRGQAMIKLYVLMAIMEVFDRLMCSLGQNALDSLYWNTTHRPKSRRMIVSVVVVFMYATLHSLLLFMHVTALNVAVNSADQALLTLLISGNFAEIKSTVFKKYNEQILFSITASDICERFKLALFLSLVFILNCFQGGMNQTMIMNYLKMSAFVLTAEMLTDWIKHSFISKFNFISINVYPRYALTLAGDVTGVGHEGLQINHTHAVVKRLGMAQIPLVCVMARYLREAARYAVEDETDFVFSWKRWPFMLVSVYMLLLLVKIVLGFTLERTSQAMIATATVEPVSTTKCKK
eukprot:CAMPEP_0118703140 /NCGR_PEP_ID=MMETSP0800-20121206/18352_1 /TAXON_ID=210618 ORGANISM="Striatella unipunctata, Strain CCMP2910" /NCGR_SAMPLE_ID=MMETSP0800 /ASSEMBLY_ACC=CAM_ASM_000638 /LENGTH=747 /DNA_ID=CAMNT_0006604561 /DNA_START=272 /DNA_END=2515 /DNA_ORIENTATION=+